MSVFLKEKNISYISIPKVACTSIKDYFFFYENNYRFEKPIYANGKEINLHKLYKGRRFIELSKFNITETRIFAVVRDPISRFLSTFNNRASKYFAKSKEKINNQVSVDIHYYITNFDFFRVNYNEIRWHSRSICDSLGDQTLIYEKIYRFDELENFNRELNNILDFNYNFPHRQKSKKIASYKDLTKNEKDKIENLYREDYKIFGKFF